MSSFKDKTLSSGLFLIDLLFALKPRAVDYDLVTPGDSGTLLARSFLLSDRQPCDVDEEKMMNAKYAIGVARKLGAMVFLVWEDIGRFSTVLSRPHLTDALYACS